MGKATIKSNAGNGYYMVTVHNDVTRANQKIEKIEAKIDTLTGVLDTLRHNKDFIFQKVEFWEQELKTLMSSGEDTRDARKEYNKYAEQIQKINKLINENSSKLAKLETEKRRIQNRAPTSEGEWALAVCADYSDSLAEGKVVGTINPAREAKTPYKGGYERKPIIYPCYTGGCTYQSSRDGIGQPAIASTPAAWLYNHIMEPGAQKWRPLYRVGEIIFANYDNNTCDVVINGNYSPNTGWLVYPSGTNSAGLLEAVPVDYMGCDIAPLSRGDRVVVEFRKSAGKYQPYVIGFEENPHPCPNLKGFWEIEVSSGGGTTGDCQDKVKHVWFEQIKVFAEDEPPDWYETSYPSLELSETLLTPSGYAFVSCGGDFSSSNEETMRLGVSHKKGKRPKATLTQKEHASSFMGFSVIPRSTVFDVYQWSYSSERALQIEKYFGSRYLKYKVLEDMAKKAQKDVGYFAYWAPISIIPVQT